jgi:hypothetical protein
MPRSNPFLTALLFILTGVFAVAQLPPPAAAPRGPVYNVPPPSLKKLTDSDVFYGPEQLFRISLPKWRETYRKLTPEETSVNSMGAQYKWVTSEAAITVTFLHAQGAAEFDTDLSPADYEARVKNILLEKIKSKLVSSKPITLGDYKGVEVIFTMPNGVKGISRSYAFGKWQYTVNAFITGTDPDAEMLAIRALDSFKILSDADRAEDVAQTIAKATPADLPQSPRPARPSSDAKDDRLKGKVKTVVRETENIGVAEQKGRKKDFEELFNEHGDMVRHTSYNYRGNPSFIKVYGYIDGSRAAKAGYMQYAYEPPPPPPPLLPSRPVAAAVVRDERYSDKYVYIYDRKDRITEELAYGNDGVLTSRITYIYDGNRVEISSLSSKGAVITKTIELTDNKGNLVERTFSMPNYPASKRTYKYDSFDSHGNWTQRTVTGKYGKYDGTFGDQNYIEYRTITYYR